MFWRWCNKLKSTPVVRRLRESGQRTFPAKTFPERCYGSDIWYPKCDVLVPNVFSQFRTIVRPPNPYLPLSLPLKGREGTERAPLRDHRVSPATDTRGPRRPRVSVARPSDGPTDPSRRSKLHIIMDSCVKRCVQTHLF